MRLIGTRVAFLLVSAVLVLGAILRRIRYSVIRRCC